MERVLQKIKAAKSVAVLAHDGEDADALGSVFAMETALKSMGKKAVVYLSEPVESRLKFMKPVVNVFDGSFEKDHDLCICLDCGDKKRLGKRAVIFDSIGNSVNIDHHYTNDMFADENFVDSGACATGEILVSVFGEMGVEITKEIAEFLYIAIVSDSGCFKYSNVTPSTMRTAAVLLEKGIDHALICRLLFDTQSIDVVKFKGEIMLGLESYAGGKITLTAAGDEIYEKYNVEQGDVGDLVNIARTVKGTEIAVNLKTKNDGVKISLRSNGNADVSRIALDFGGGGHKMASGAFIDNISINDAKDMIIKACEGELERI